MHKRIFIKAFITEHSIGIWLLLVCLFASSASMAQDNQSPIHFGVLELPPYVTSNIDGNATGLFVDIFKAYESLSERPVEIVPYPTKRLIKYMTDGTVDCTIYLRSPATDSFADPLVYMGLNFNSVVLAKKKTNLKQYDDLKNLNLGVSRGTIFGHKIDTDKEITKTITQDYGKLVQMLALDRVDAILGIDKSLLYNLKQIDFPANQIGEPLILRPNEIWLFCSRETSLTQQDMLSIKYGFDKLRESGQITAILKNYMPE